MREYEDIIGDLLDDDELEDIFGLPEEWAYRYENRWYGLYRAIVTNNDDPKKWGRVQVECPVVWGTALESPWCEPAGMLGFNSDSGLMDVPEQDAIVWVMCESGDPDRPIYIAGPIYDDVTGIPAHAQENSDDSDSSLTTAKGRGAAFIPNSAFASTYPNWRGWKTPRGHMLELDDTSGAERVQLYHRNGTSLEFATNGDAHLGATGKLRLQSLGSEVRIAATTSDGALSGNEVGIAPLAGKLGTPSTSTSPIPCGDYLITYLTALHAAITPISGTLNTSLTLVAAAMTALSSAMGALALDTGVNATTQSTAGTAATAAAAAVADLGTSAAAMLTMANAINALPPVYFTTPATSILSTQWNVAKFPGPQES